MNTLLYKSLTTSLIISLGPTLRNKSCKFLRFSLKFKGDPVSFREDHSFKDKSLSLPGFALWLKPEIL